MVGGGWSGPGHDDYGFHTKSVNNVLNVILSVSVSSFLFCGGMSCKGVELDVS